jgi:hypothetical protein
MLIAMVGIEFCERRVLLRGFSAQTLDWRLEESDSATDEIIA